MKKCPGCGYGNSAASTECAVCGCGLAGVRADPPQAPGKRSGPMAAAALLLLGCTLLFYGVQRFAWDKAAPPAAVSDELPDPAGIVHSLERMAHLRFLPDPDKARALSLLFIGDGEIAGAAARTAGAWARAEKDPARALPLMEKLLEAAGAGRPSARRQAALEAGLTLMHGFPASALGGRVREISGLLVRETDPDLKAAGFLLSALAGIEDYVPLMRDTLLGDPLRINKLYAACALSRLGDAAGHAYLLRAASSGDDLALEAISCLSYSASPEAGPLLSAASKNRFDGAAAERAKMALILREQLAIIKK